MSRLPLASLFVVLLLIGSSGCGQAPPSANSSRSEVQLPKNPNQKGNQGISVDTFQMPKDVLVSPKKKQA